MFDLRSLFWGFSVNRNLDEFMEFHTFVLNLSLIVKRRIDNFYLSCKVIIVIVFVRFRDIDDYTEK